MIISHRYRYLFVEHPHTASTAIAAELTEHYDGQPIVTKHANYADFLRQASSEEKKYAVVIGTRHPLDRMASLYFKLKNNHHGEYTNPALFEENGGWVSLHVRRMYAYVQENDASFADYYKQFYASRWAKSNQYIWFPRRYDYIIRYESIQDDFAGFLRFVGAEQVRSLPVVNKTSGKRDYLSLYTPDIRDKVVRQYGPYMAYWGYAFPGDWNVGRAPWASRQQFHLVNTVGRLCIEHLGLTPGDYSRARKRLTRLMRGRQVAAAGG